VKRDLPDVSRVDQRAERNFLSVEVGENRPIIIRSRLERTVLGIGIEERGAWDRIDPREQAQSEIGTFLVVDEGRILVAVVVGIGRGAHAQIAQVSQRNRLSSRSPGLAQRWQ